MASKRIAGITIELSTDTAKLTKGLDKVAKNFEGLGKSLTKNVTAPLLAIGGAAVKVGMDFDKSMSQVAATMGLTADEINEVGGDFEKLRNFAQEMGSTTAFSATQAAEALNFMALAGYDAETSMKMLPNVLNLAAAGGIELAQASDMVTDAQSALGLTLEQTEILVDQMAKTSSKTNTSVAQLGEGILKIGATARNVKGGTAELTQVLGLLADNGIKGAEGGTHLRNMLLSLQQAAVDGAVSFGDFSVSVYDAEGNMRGIPDIMKEISEGMSDANGYTQEMRDTMLTDVFNKTDLAAVNSLLGTSVKRWDEVESAIADAKGAAQQMADTQLDNFAGSLTLLKSALEGAAISISDVLAPSLRKLAEFITGLVDKFNQLSPETKEMIVRIGLIAAAIGPILLLIGKVISAVSAVIAIGSKLSGVFAMLTGPIGLVVAAVAAAIAIGVALYKNWDEIKAKAEEIWTAIKDFFTETWDAITTKVKETWETIKTTLSDVWNGIKETAQMVWDGIKLYFETVLSFWTNLFTNTWKGIKDTVLGVWNGIKTQAEIIWTALKMAIEDPIGALKYFLENTWENIKTTAANVWEGIKGVITAPIDAAVSVISGLIEKVKGLFPIKLSNVFSGFKLPHISYEMVEGFLGIKYPKFSVDWYKKAYENGMRFSQPTVLQTPQGYKGFGDGNGAEWVVGENSLLSKIQRAVNGSQLNPAQIYEAVRQGASDATLNLYADGQKLTNTVNARNTMMLANTRRNQGAF